MSVNRITCRTLWSSVNSTLCSWNTFPRQLVWLIPLVNSRQREIYTCKPSKAHTYTQTCTTTWKHTFAHTNAHTLRHSESRGRDLGSRRHEVWPLRGLTNTHVPSSLSPLFHLRPSLSHSFTLSVCHTASSLARGQPRGGSVCVMQGGWHWTLCDAIWYWVATTDLTFISHMHQRQRDSWCFVGVNTQCLGGWAAQECGIKGGHCAFFREWEAHRKWSGDLKGFFLAVILSQSFLFLPWNRLYLTSLGFTSRKCSFISVFTHWLCPSVSHSQRSPPALLLRTSLLAAGPTSPSWSSGSLRPKATRTVSSGATPSGKIPVHPLMPFLFLFIHLFIYFLSVGIISMHVLLVSKCLQYKIGNKSSFWKGEKSVPFCLSWSCYFKLIEFISICDFANFLCEKGHSEMKSCPFFCTHQILKIPPKRSWSV